MGGLVATDSIRQAHLHTLGRIDDLDTYLPAMLAQSDSMLKRWPNRMSRPLRVYLPSGNVPVAGYRPDMRTAAQTAFRRWERVAEIPIRFEFVRDSSRAEVIVRWISAFAIRRTGQADIAWNRAGWIQHGTLTLATHTNAGWELSDDAIHTVALHEIGHLLGLGHSDDPNDVMYPSTEVHDITARDRQTARELYLLAPGSLRLP